MLQHVYSFCDISTLAAICLMSFESWEMAGPFLYEHVEIRSFDGLKALFFLVSPTLEPVHLLYIADLPFLATVAVDLLRGTFPRLLAFGTWPFPCSPGPSRSRSTSPAGDSKRCLASEDQTNIEPAIRMLSARGRSSPTD